MSFGGGFFGGGESNKTTKQTSTSTTTTNTESNQETNIGSVGVTGQNAVDIVGVINAGETDRTALFADSFDKVVQALGIGYNSLIGGAGLLTTNAQELAHRAQLDADALISRANDDAAATRASASAYANSVTGSAAEVAAKTNANALDAVRASAASASGFIEDNRTLVFAVLGVALLGAGFLYYKRHR